MLFQGESGVTIRQAAIWMVMREAIIHVAAADDSSSLLSISILQDRIFLGTPEIRTEMDKVGPFSELITSEEIFSDFLFEKTCYVKHPGFTNAVQ